MIKYLLNFTISCLPEVEDWGDIYWTPQLAMSKRYQASPSFTLQKSETSMLLVA